MKKYFLVNNRHSGKTNMALYEFLKSPDDSLFITFNSASTRDNLEKLKLSPYKYRNSFLSAEAISQGALCSHRYKRLILDEYFHFNLDFRKNLPGWTYPLGIEEIYCFGTPKNLYNKQLFEFVKNLKENNHPFDSRYTIEKIKDMKPLELPLELVMHQIEDLYYNLITDKDMIIIDNPGLHNQTMYNNPIFGTPDSFISMSEQYGHYLTQN
jgi:hypothetical protein